MFEGPSKYAESVDIAMLYIAGISIVLLLGITAFMIYFVIRYSRKRNPNPAQIHGNVMLEIAWIIIPAIIVISMFWYGFKDYDKLLDKFDESQIVEVTGRMWEWEFKYPNGKVTDTLFVPVDQATQLKMISQDVIHSLYIPAFRLKEDVLPGRTTYLMLEPHKTGKYDIACAEYCGLNHAYMYTKLHVMPEGEYQQWYESEIINGAGENNESEQDEENQTGEGTEENNDDNAAKDIIGMSGQEFSAYLSGHDDFKLLLENGCISCHSTDGSKMSGPSFAELTKKERTVLKNGKEKKVKIDSEYIKKSITEPNESIVKGYRRNSMPPQGERLTEEELDRITKLLTPRNVQ
ncbi:MAG: cytochrome c oxidase subunit II [Candidatus Kapaibacterium sp.]